MTWEVEVSDEFREWYLDLSIGERSSVAAGVDMIQSYGPELGRPHVDTLSGSKYPNMKELRVQHQASLTAFSLRSIHAAMPI
jgi:hypothetical protein